MSKQQQFQNDLILITREFLIASATERALDAVSLDADFERDLGIDSLAKVELFRRIENHFSLALPNRAITQSQTLKDVIPFLSEAKPQKKAKKTSFTSKLAKAEINFDEIKTLPEALMAHAVKDPKRAHIYLQDEEGEETTITYGDLFENAKLLAKGLVVNGIKSGDTVAIMVPTGMDFFVSFLGVMLIGAIPVPIYPPFRPDKIEEYIQREAKILQNAEIRMLITFSKATFLSKMLRSFIPSLTSVTTVENLKANNLTLPEIDYDSESYAFIQYTSGSTGDPKGVLLNHKNILSNVRAIGKAIDLKPDDVAVSWLPLYHDMGLMSWLVAMFFGIPISIMSPLSFLQRPERWLWTIHYHRASLSAGPNFAYELCLRKIDDKQIEGLDLSSWRRAFNGAEAINPDTFRRFLQRYKKYGFKESSIYPVYGLAENTVALTFPQGEKNFVVDKVDKKAFESKQIAKPADNKEYLEFICCGSPIPDHKIRIVDDENKELEERHVGNLQFTGPSAMQGYYRREEITKKAYHDGWWDTGDLAYIAEGELYITGRRKDLIIKAGRNLYPQTIEDEVMKHPKIRKGCVAAFGVEDRESGTEKLIIVAEMKNDADKKQLYKELLSNVSDSTGIPPDEIILVKPKTIPKTSSGKLQRSQCKAMYLQGELSKQKISVKKQITKLFMQSAWIKLKNITSLSGKFIYSFYVFLCLAITIPLLWIGVLISSKNLAKIITKFWAKLLLKLAFCPVKVVNSQNFEQNKNVIFACNHASYMDAIVLLAYLPLDTVYIGKKELLRSKLFRHFTKKINFVSVDRYEFSKNIDDTNIISDRLKTKESILIFPEGTFSYATGLRAFKMGAFQLAIQTNTPICPIAIKGTRKILRGDERLAWPGKIIFTVGELLLPEGDDWQAAIDLKQKTRDFIAKHCGEASLDMLRAGPEKRS